MLTCHFQSPMCNYEAFLIRLYQTDHPAKVLTHLPSSRDSKDEELKPKDSGSRKPLLVAWGSQTNAMPAWKGEGEGGTV